MQNTITQAPFSAKLAKPPRKPINSAIRAREFLASHEVTRLIEAAKSQGRHCHRDATLILLMFRHALRAGESVALRWEQVDLKQGLLHVRRLKNGLPSTHPLRGVELRSLRELQRHYPQTPYVFISEGGAPLTTRTVHHIIARAGKRAKLDMSVHPHMLRHATGFYLANKGHDTRSIQQYMGHANIKNTVIYTEISPDRFNQFWQD